MIVRMSSNLSLNSVGFEPGLLYIVPTSRLDLVISYVHIQHLGRILSDLGFGLLGLNTLSRIIPDLARPAYIGGLARLPSAQPAYIRQCEQEKPNEHEGSV